MMQRERESESDASAAISHQQAVHTTSTTSQKLLLGYIIIMVLRYTKVALISAATGNSLKFIFRASFLYGTIPPNIPENMPPNLQQRMRYSLPFVVRCCSLTLLFLLLRSGTYLSVCTHKYFFLHARHARPFVPVETPYFS